MSTTPTLQQLQRGLQISEQIAALEAEMAALFNGSAPTSPATVSAKRDGRSGKRSAKTIAKMKAAQQARWAKSRTISPLDTLDTRASTPVKRRKPMSPEHRAKLAASAKARWAAKKDTQEA